MQYLDDYLPGLTNSNNLMVLRTQQVDMGNAAHALTLVTADTGQTEISAMIIEVDPAGGAQNLTLPPEESAAGVVLVIRNSADAAENVVVKNDAAATVVTLAQGKASLLACIPNAAGTPTWRELLTLA